MRILTIGTHPETGRKALWLNSKSEVELVNYDDQAGAKLIAELRQHLKNLSFAININGKLEILSFGTIK
jgi:taurine dioxygenase